MCIFFLLQPARGRLGSQNRLLRSTCVAKPSQNRLSSLIGVAKLPPEVDFGRKTASRGRFLSQNRFPRSTGVAKLPPEVDWGCETASQLTLTGPHPCSDGIRRRLQVTERVFGGYGCLHLFASGSGLCVRARWVAFDFVKSAASVPAFQARIGR